MVSRSWHARGLLIALVLCASAQGHDIITTPLTWNREISRLVFAHCASCHHEGGRAFSLMTYDAARPWAEAMKDETRERRMPPWGAVKGFGDFRNDQALSQEDIDLLAGWANGGAPEGDDAKDLPNPPEFNAPPAENHVPGEIQVSGDFSLSRAMVLDGLLPVTVPEKASIQITAELPDGSVVPLLWVYGYKAAFHHEFLLRHPLALPKGTMIHGVPAEARVNFLPAGMHSGTSPAKRSSAAIPKAALPRNP